MAIGNVSEINEIKDILNELKSKGVLSLWELPYEYLLTRLSAAIFFLSPASEANCDEIWKQLGHIPGFQYSCNDEKEMSSMEYMVTFNKFDNNISRDS